MLRRTILCLLLSLGVCAVAQDVSFRTTQMPYGDALDKVLATNVLTHDGTPFHALLSFKPEKSDASQKLSGSVEIFWAAPDRYHLKVSSPDFEQTLIVQGDRVQETDRGDFYPNFLQNFVTGLLNPMPRLAQIREHPNRITGGPSGSFMMQPCVGRDDRPGGITDQLTWAEICFDNDSPQLEFVIDFTYNMQFASFTSFHHKQIAQAYTTGTANSDHIVGKLTTLEDWTPDDAILEVTAPTSLQDRILTTLVSTATEESMAESIPKDVQWPGVREGKTEGYMIVQAITDRSGQVRETSKHNSDNPGLESFGRDVALKYKFKPLVVDGAPHQMAMPLVLHFTTKLTNPIPELDDKTTRKLITGCSLPHEIKDPASAGQVIAIQFQVQNDGGLMTLGSSDRKIPVMSLFEQFRGCHFAQYKQNGIPSAYHANLSVTAR